MLQQWDSYSGNKHIEKAKENSHDDGEKKTPLQEAGPKWNRRLKVSKKKTEKHWMIYLMCLTILKAELNIRRRVWSWINDECMENY